MTDHLSRCRDALEAAGIEVNEVRALPTGLGHQLRCAGGRVVVVYNSGAVVAQGKDAAAVKSILAGVLVAPKQAKASKPAPVTAAVSAIPAPEASGPAQSRLPPGWSTEPWNGMSVPW